MARVAYSAARGAPGGVCGESTSGVCTRTDTVSVTPCPRTSCPRTRIAPRSAHGVADTLNNTRLPLRMSLVSGEPSPYRPVSCRAQHVGALGAATSAATCAPCTSPIPPGSGDCHSTVPIATPGRMSSPTAPSAIPRSAAARNATPRGRPVKSGIRLDRKRDPGRPHGDALSGTRQPVARAPGDAVGARVSTNTPAASNSHYGCRDTQRPHPARRAHRVIFVQRGSPDGLTARRRGGRPAPVSRGPWRMHDYWFGEALGASIGSRSPARHRRSLVRVGRRGPSHSDPFRSRDS
jgi:hypothetical protein